jgi:hypothetical protein
MSNLIFICRFLVEADHVSFGRLVGVLALQRIKVLLHSLSHLLLGQALIVSGGNEWHSFVDLDQYE